MTAPWWGREASPNDLPVMVASSGPARKQPQVHPARRGQQDRQIEELVLERAAHGRRDKVDAAAVSDRPSQGYLSGRHPNIPESGTAKAMPERALTALEPFQHSSTGRRPTPPPGHP